MNEQNVKKLSFQKKKGNVQKIRKSRVEKKLNDGEFCMYQTYLFQ